MTASFSGRSLVTRNVRNVVSDERGAVVRVREGIATVLLTETGKLARMPSSELVVTRGRPIKLIKGLVREDINELIMSSETFRVAGLQAMFARQTDDERDSKATRHDNKNGFRVDDAKDGSALALKDGSTWTGEDHLTAIQCLLPYSGTQLWDLASMFLTEPESLASLTQVAMPEKEKVVSFLLDLPTSPNAIATMAHAEVSEVDALIAELLLDAGYESPVFEALVENDAFALELASIQANIE